MEESSNFLRIIIYYVYVIDGFNVITIQKDFSKKYFHNTDSYIGRVLKKEGGNVILEGDDIGVQVKSLILAKRPGWNIKSIEV